jgi:methylphosphotriester-DNA--protein-cysteine methyltransferase
MSHQRSAIQHAKRSKPEHTARQSAQLVSANLSLIGTDWRAEELQRFINSAHGKLGLNLDNICKHLDLGVSGSYGARLFKKHTGLGIREYAKRKRLALAAHQLANTTLSVKEIAADLGYRSQTDLSRQFRQLFQLNPRRYRDVYRRATPQLSELDRSPEHDLFEKRSGL